MKQPKKIWLTVICLLWLGISIFTRNEIQIEAKEIESIENAKAGIVEIFSGFYDTKGKFRKLQSGSGFLVRNTDNDTYIITNLSVTTISDKDKKSYCKKNKIKIDGNIPETVIKVIIKGDVSVEAEILTESEEKDFCILSTANVVNEKNALKLENSEEVKVGDAVYALGFPNEENMEYLPEEVECSLGTIDASELNWNNTLHIQHTAYLSEAGMGGPLLNEAGYVVGVNCKKVLEDKTEIYCTLPIKEIIEVLDNFSIHYESSLRERLNTDLEQLYTESIALLESKDYKKESLEKLKLAVAETEKLKEKSAEETEIVELEKACKELEDAKHALVPKMKKIQIVIYVLAGVIVILFIWLVVLLILKLASRKKGLSIQRLEKQQPIEQNQLVMQSVPLSLIHQRTRQAQTISDRKMIVGKSPQKADFSIPDNKMVSREHAAFQQQNGKYYVCDLNSVNGTYINGSRIPAESYVEIKSGDEIVLANERFEIR